MRILFGRIFHLRPLYIYLTLVLSSAPSFAETYEFALIGDLPYGVKPGVDSSQLNTLQEQINAHDFSWVLHVGDIKNGAENCHNRLLQDRASRFQKFKAPFIFTPGDNEWTDCYRFIAGSHKPLERLTKLREIFFSTDKIQRLEDQLNIQSQAKVDSTHSEFIENFYWQTEFVSYATIHIVGSMNGRHQLDKKASDEKQDLEKEIERREKAALDWLDHAFEYANKNNSKALFIAIHANPALGSEYDKPTKKAYEEFIDRLKTNTKTFIKPVVLAHGDSHYFRIDKPKLNGKASPSNFTRIETFGDSNNDWIRVSVDTESRNVFSFEAHDN